MPGVWLTEPAPLLLWLDGLRDMVGPSVGASMASIEVMKPVSNLATISCISRVRHLTSVSWVFDTT
jgi:hypothetical protein